MTFNHPTNDRLNDLLQHADWLARLARKLVRDGHVAEEVFQEALLAARGSHVPAGVPERSWLAGILRNVARTRIRHEGRLADRERRAARSEADVRPDPPQGLTIIERQRELLGHVEALPDAQRRAVLSRFYEGLPPRKIAAAEGVAVSTVESRIQRGLSTLRERLDAEYGDRRNWAAWVTPMAGMAPKAQGVGAAGLILLAAGTLAVFGGAVIWLGSGTPGAEPTDVAAVQDVAPASGATTASAEPDEGDLAPIGNVAVGDRTAPDAPVPTTRVQVLFDGVPVPGAHVITLPASRIENSVEDLFRFSGVIWNGGEHSLADDQGFVELPAPERLVVLGSSAIGLGFAGIEPEGDDTVINLERSARLMVDVLDADGEPLAPGAEEGLSVIAFTLYDLPETDTHTGSSDLPGTSSKLVRGGQVWFQNPWYGMSFSGVPVDLKQWNKAIIEAVAIDVPGAAEFEPEAVSTRRFLPFKKRPRDQERTLRVPDVGSLRIVVVDERGKLDPVNGTVSLQFDRAPFRGRAKRSYVVPIDSGVAEFPRFVIGERPFTATVNLPAEGASWTFEDHGPAERGERRNVTTVRSIRPVVRARLVDEQGDPMELGTVLFRHGRPGTSFSGVTGQLSAASGKDGEVRFEIPDDLPLAAPFTLHAFGGTWQGRTEALQILDLNVETVKQGVDLGDVSLRMMKDSIVEGRVLSYSGDPLEEIHVSVGRPGAPGYAAFTDAQGRFSISTVLFESATISVSDMDGRFVEIKEPLALPLGDEPLEFRLSRGATFLADVDLEGFEGEGLRLTCYLRPDEAESRYEFSQVTGPGSFQFHAVAPGRYTAELRLDGGNVPIAEVPGIVIPEDGEVRDPRLDAIRVADLVREIHVVVDEPATERLPSMKVLAHVQPDWNGKSRGVVSVYPNQSSTARYFLPLHLPSSVRFGLPGDREVFFSDASALGPVVHLRFGEPFPVLIPLEGASKRGFRYSLQGEVGTPTEGIHASLALGEASGTPSSVEVQLPRAGTYRLYRVKAPEAVPDGQGMMSAAMAEPTTATVEVTRESATALRLDAPLRRDSND